jgi:hypothetical protein
MSARTIVGIFITAAVLLSAGMEIVRLPTTAGNQNALNFLTGAGFPGK